MADTRLPRELTHGGEQLGLRAMERAEAAMVQAKARAAAMVADAQARALRLNTAKAPETVDPDAFRAKVALRAYYKASRRGFGPGRETDDWLAAERELLDQASLHPQKRIP